MVNKLKVCLWWLDRGLWMAGCKREPVNLQGMSPQELGYVFCPFCGGLIKVE